MRTAAKFWAKVRRGDGCWEWTGAKSSSGYGSMDWFGRSTLPHRVSWRLRRGRIPRRKCVLHKCDNRICVRPSHLFLGTYRDNLHDAIRKGRHKPQRAEKHGMSKLTWDDVDNIRRIYVPGVLGTVRLGRMFDVEPQTIWMIVKGRHWKEEHRPKEIAA